MFGRYLLEISFNYCTTKSFTKILKYDNMNIWAINSAGEYPLDVRKATGSNPVLPTIQELSELIYFSCKLIFLKLAHIRVSYCLVVKHSKFKIHLFIEARV